MREQTLYSSKCELLGARQSASVTLGGRERKIEYFIPASPSFPGNSQYKKDRRQVDSLAACSRDLLYGVGRNLRHRGDYFRRWIRARDPGTAFSSCAVVLADRIHDW